MLSRKVESRRARARYLAQSIQLEESDVPGVVSMTVFTAALLMGGAVAWASVTPVEEVARSAGEVIPAGHHHRVQHLEGGSVEAILVNKGERVSAGQVLVRLSDVVPRSEMEQARVQRANLLLERERLLALDEVRTPDFGAIAADYPRLAVKQEALFRSQRLSHLNQLDVIDSQTRQRRAEFAQQELRTDALSRQRSLLAERRQMYESLERSGTVARADLLATRAREAEVEADYRQVHGSIAVTESAIAESLERRQEIEQRHSERLRSEMAGIEAELAQAEQRFQRASDRLQRLEIRAPVNGLVKGLVVNTVNQVVAPGEVLMEIVPVSGRMVVRSRISSIDVGHVQVGQIAKVEVDSFDATRFGDIKGKVKHISASTFMDESGRPYYRAEIVLDRDYVGEDPARHRLIPGMTVQASVITGAKTVMDYLMRPVYRGLSSAFRER